MSNPRFKSKQQLVKKNREEGDLCEVRMTKADVIGFLEGFGQTKERVLTGEQCA